MAYYLRPEFGKAQGQFVNLFFTHQLTRFTGRLDDLPGPVLDGF